MRHSPGDRHCHFTAWAVGVARLSSLPGGPLLISSFICLMLPPWARARYTVVRLGLTRPPVLPPRLPLQFQFELRSHRRAPVFPPHPRGPLVAPPRSETEGSSISGLQRAEPLQLSPGGRRLRSASALESPAPAEGQAAGSGVRRLGPDPCDRAPRLPGRLPRVSTAAPALIAPGPARNIRMITGPSGARGLCVRHLRHLGHAPSTLSSVN
ncbi:hypothetical protein NDU88_001696 [Pleurodeles waltl]|uniref:Uncharacterized protein n=1 Tax=Pleurodeles waltl TaxID=8319 RepID=A0AAV7VAE9_PLEWA|nr:hypothetical protein NDU88_001696 [Pleurodeles waltl]